MQQPAADHNTLEAISRRIRGELVRLSSRTGAAHLGSALSCVDILVAAYWASLSIDPSQPDDPQRDRLILSKGHAAAAWYATLCERGFFSREVLETYALPGTKLAEHPSPNGAPGVEAGTGSLGHGLPLGAGIALAGRLRSRPYRVCVVLSDGECNEGSVWEAALFAAVPTPRPPRQSWSTIISGRPPGDRTKYSGWLLCGKNGKPLGGTLARSMVTTRRRLPKSSATCRTPAGSPWP